MQQSQESNRRILRAALPNLAPGYGDAAHDKAAERLARDMDPGFTPGPWTPVTGQGAHHRDIYIRHGERQPDGTWPAVAKCCSSRVGSFATVETNARLIAAAPDLYAALEALAARFDSRVSDSQRYPELAAARAALARAKGGAA